MVYLLSIANIIICIKYSLLFSHTVHLSTACPSSTPPYSFLPPPFALHPFFLSLPRKEQASLGDPDKTQDQQQPSLCGTNPRRKRVPKAGRVSEWPQKTKPTTYQICGGPVPKPCRISVSLHEHCLADASSVLSSCLQPLCIQFLLLFPGIPWSLSVETGWKPPNWVFSFFYRSLHLLPSASSGSLVDHHWTKQF